jgi:hypothetical protein
MLTKAACTAFSPEELRPLPPLAATSRGSMKSSALKNSRRASDSAGLAGTLSLSSGGGPGRAVGRIYLVLLTEQPCSTIRRLRNAARTISS